MCVAHSGRLALLDAESFDLRHPQAHGREASQGTSSGVTSVKTPVRSRANREAWESLESSAAGRKSLADIVSSIVRGHARKNNRLVHGTRIAVSVLCIGVLRSTEGRVIGGSINIPTCPNPGGARILCGLRVGPSFSGDFTWSIQQSQIVSSLDLITGRIRWRAAMESAWMTELLFLTWSSGRCRLVGRLCAAEIGSFVTGRFDAGASLESGAVWWPATASARLRGSPTIGPTGVWPSAHSSRPSA